MRQEIEMWLSLPKATCHTFVLCIVLVSLSIPYLPAPAISSHFGWHHLSRFEWVGEWVGGWVGGANKQEIQEQQKRSSGNIRFLSCSGATFLAGVLLYTHLSVCTAPVEVLAPSLQVQFSLDSSNTVIQLHSLPTKLWVPMAFLPLQVSQ